jgi:hypothetical protein
MGLMKRAKNIEIEVQAIQTTLEQRAAGLDRLWLLVGEWRVSFARRTR